MHLILIVLRLLFGCDFLRSAPEAQLAVRCDGKLQGFTEPGQRNVPADLAKWLTILVPCRQLARRAGNQESGRDRPISPSRRQ